MLYSEMTAVSTKVITVFHMAQNTLYFVAWEGFKLLISSTVKSVCVVQYFEILAGQQPTDGNIQ